MYEPNLSCLMCGAEDTQEHLIVSCKASEDLDTNDVSSEDIFGSVERQTKIIKILKQIDEKRYISKKSS